jgi:large subunit ribosomal protein L15
MPLALRLARKRGFTNKWRVEYEWVNISQLARLSATEVTPESLAAAGLTRRSRLPLKVLGDGEIDKPLTVSAHAFTGSARSKIEAAGGHVVQLPGRAADRAARLQQEEREEVERAAAAEVADSEPVEESPPEA